ncbi:unnamed protein product, partial [Amoebophrya sp. A25]
GTSSSGTARGAAASETSSQSSSARRPRPTPLSDDAGLLPGSHPDWFPLPCRSPLT